ncbi:OmpA family protein [Tenuifilum thalassicum]|uniref:OmpA family protein n=1 Tax=Tenuifilum thalassicum TaxID=2590900 RepID=A0A7D3XFE3_9BACT|nr:OmpA family protein [Tenuifilum thalassicum]QKG79337.1 OmpA family protein [Tenuifilum thalassicum]
MKKFTSLSLITFLVFGSRIALGQPDNFFVNSKGDVFVKADAPVYFFISPSNSPNQKVMIPSTDKAANPMFFDGDGKHYFVYESNGNKVRFLVYADGYGPKSYLKVTSGLLFEHKNRVYVKDSAGFTLVARDKRSGVKNSYFALDSLPFKPYNDVITINNIGEHTIRIYSTDNVGNIGDTSEYHIIAAPDITFRVNNIYFQTASARLTQNSFEVLAEILDILKKYPELHVEISAHADVRGSSDSNMKLSQRRAQSVVNYLVSKGVPSYRLYAKGYGDTRPINECVKGVKCSDLKHRENRRVEFRFYVPRK